MNIGPLHIHRKYQDDLPEFCQPFLTVHWEWRSTVWRIFYVWIRGFGPSEGKPEESRP